MRTGSEEPMAAESSKLVRIGNKDRLSALPDAILHHILSFLPTENAVATSLLSTRWKYLYRSVPKIDLDDSLHPYVREEKGPKRTYDGFIRFTTRMLLLRNGADIAQFFLKCKNYTYDNSLINDWVCSALCHNVQELDILISYIKRPTHNLTTEIFTHKRLVTLKLYGIVINVPELVTLPNLKILVLEYVLFPDRDEAISKFLKGCTSLEDLELIHSPLEEVRILDLSITSLRSARFYDVDCEKVVIDSPNLKHLMISTDDPFDNSYVLKNLKSLVKAEIELGGVEELFGNIDGLHNVEFLSVAGGAYPVPLDFSCSCKFPNLARMEFVGLDEISWGILPHLLDSAPKLQMLVLDMGFHDGFDPERFLYNSLPMKPSCLAQMLREVEIVDFCCCETAFIVVEYLLHYGAVLEVMSFKFSEKRVSAEKWSYSDWRRLLMLPRCSKTCKIVLPEKK